MKMSEWISTIIGSLNLIVIGFFTWRMTKANETLTKLQNDVVEKDQPLLSCWFRDLDNKNKEMSLINLGNKDLIITYMSIQISNKSCDWIHSITDGSFPQFDDYSLCNIALKNGVIYRFHFGSNVHGGQIGGALILQNIKGEQIIMNFHMNKYGPYKLDKDDFFHYS